MPATIQTIQKPTKARALDTSGNNNHGQIYSGRALEFDGVSDYLLCGGIDKCVDIRTDSGSATFVCWFKVDDATPEAALVINGNTPDSAEHRLGLSVESEVVVWNKYDGSYTPFNSSTIEDNTWYRAVGIIVDGTMSMYLNGVAQTDTGDVQSYLSGTDDLTIGRTGSSTPSNMKLFAGKICDVQIWDAAWTAEDALYDYNNPEQLALNRGGTSLTNSNLKAWYPMNDGHRGQQSYVLDASNTGLGDEMISSDLDSQFAESTTDSNQTVTYPTSSSVNLVTTDGQSVGITDTDLLTTGINYKIIFDVTVNSGIGIRFQSNTTVYQNMASTGIYEFYYTAENSHFQIYRRTAGATDTTINSISVKPVNDKNHATTVFYGDELISAEKNRVFGSSPDWTGGTANGSNTNNDFATYDEAATSGATEGDYFTDNYLKVISDDDPSNIQYCWLDGANFGESSMVVGRRYRLQFSCQISYTKGNFYVGFGTAAGAVDGDADYAAAGNLAASTQTIDFTYKGTTDHAKLLVKVNTSTVVTAYLDNFTLKEIGTASGWTDADQQLDIPQTALQSYNQLAWWNGTSDYVQLSDPYNHNLITVSAWIYLNEDNAEHKCWFANRDSADDGILATISGSEKVYVKFNGTTCTSSASVSIGEWNHIVYTYDDATMKLYINGEQDSTTTSFTASDISVTTNATIGKDSFQNTYYFSGCIAEVSIWGAALTQAEINELYNDGKALDATIHSKAISASTNLKGYFRNNGLATWTDLSDDYSNNGTVTASETMLITPGVDGSRDSQGFLMNRQRATNSLNLYENGGDTSNGPLVEVLDKPENTTGNFDSTGDGLGDFTVEFWFKGTGNASNNMILIQSVYKDGSNNYSGFDINMDADDGEIRCHYYKGSGSDSEVWSFSGSNGAVNFYDNEWHHYVMVVKRTGGGAAVHTIIDKICRDKVSGTPLSNASSIKAFLSSIKIGGSDSDIIQGSVTNRQPFSGQIDDIKIYKKALTAWESDGSSLEEGDTVTSGEVSRNYNAGKRSHK